VTEEIKDAVVSKHKENPRLGCWRLSLFDYEKQQLSPVTIWHILNENKKPKKPPEILYIITRFHQIWFIDHMHLRTLKNGQKVYSLLIIDGMSRVLLSDEICLSKSARDACLILLRTFMRWGLPEEIVSDNAKAFTSFLYTTLLGALSVRVRHITPGCPWENPFAESLVGTLRDYLYPHVQRKKSVSGVRSIYSEKVDEYNKRVHWAFKKDDVKTPLGKLAGTKGRDMPLPFSLEVVATKKHVSRKVDGQGRISWKRYRLYIHAELAKEKVEIREFFTSLVVTYKSGAVVTYQLNYEETGAAPPRKSGGEGITSVDSTPVFHDNSGIEKSPQLELFDISDFASRMRYVTKRPPYQKRRIFPIDAVQLVIEGIG
jgi:transposase InsO family protein